MHAEFIYKPEVPAVLPSSSKTTKVAKETKENISITSNTQKKLYIAPTLPNSYNIKIYPEASVIINKLYNIHSILHSGKSITGTGLGR